MLTRMVGAALCALVAVVAVDCGDAGDVAATPVLADPALRTAFDPLVAQNPLAPNPVEVAYGSAATEGDRATVLATADAAAFETLAGQDRLAAEPQVFARSHLTLVTAPGNPKAVHTMTDLNRADVRTVLADPATALGDASALAFAKAKTRASASAARVADGDAVVEAVATGAADAGIVEASVPRDGVESVELPEAEDVALEYRIAAVTASQAASGFVALVLSDAGRAALTSAGFGLP